MPRQATGTIEFRPAKPGQSAGWWAKVTCADGSRTPYRLIGTWPNSPQGRARALETAAALSERMRADGLSAVPARQRRTGLPGTSMQSWVDAWIASRDARGYTSTRENTSHYQRHIRPVLGDLHVREWTVDDLRKLSAALDRKVQRAQLSWRTVWNVWATATKMCGDACRSKLDTIRCRTGNPATEVAGPDRGARTEKQFLYPSEFEKFAACNAVPRRWRIAVTLAVYLYPRAAELRSLEWDAIDLEHGTIHIHQAQDRVTGKTKATKTGQARRFTIEAALLPVLKRLKDEGGDAVCELPSDRDLARGLRRWLKHAGVNRAELHDSSPTRKAMTFHDLRATGLTWMAVRGDDPLKIQQRAGHTDFATTQGYIRLAESVRAGFGTPFPELPAGLLEERVFGSVLDVRPDSIVQGIVQNRANYPKSLRGGRDSNPRPPA